MSISFQPQSNILGLLHDRANFVTILGLVLSILGLFEAILGNIHIAAAYLGGALLADMLDGWFARKTANRPPYMSLMGAQLDSLCDVLHGAVLPAVLLGSVLGWNKLSMTVAALLAVCAVTRLSYFIIMEPRTDGSYLGVPVIFTSLLTCLCFAVVPEQFRATLLLILLVGLALLNISAIRVPKLKGTKLMIFNLLCVVGICLNYWHGVSYIVL